MRAIQAQCDISMYFIYILIESIVIILLLVLCTGFLMLLASPFRFGARPLLSEHN